MGFNLPRPRLAGSDAPGNALRLCQWIWAARPVGVTGGGGGGNGGPAFRREGEERDLLLHGRRCVACRLVRSQAEAGEARRPAVYGIEEPDGERESPVAEEPLDVRSPRRVGAAG